MEGLVWAVSWLVPVWGLEEALLSGNETGSALMGREEETDAEAGMSTGAIVGWALGGTGFFVLAVLVALVAVNRKKGIVSPSEKRQMDAAKTRAELAAQRCPVCRTGTWVKKKVGNFIKKEVILCDKCGKLQSEVRPPTSA